MEKKKRDSAIQSQGEILLNENEAATSASQVEQISIEDESEPSRMDRVKEVAENIGITINGI